MWLSGSAAAKEAIFTQFELPPFMQAISTISRI
jgi:hypothetical protein